MYGSADYLDELEAGKSDLKWLGVSCCGFHESWTKQTANSEKHEFNSDEALLTISALREGLGVSYLACHIGDAEPTLRRYCMPESRFDLGMWLLIHPESRSNIRVITFRDFMVREIQAQQHILAGLPAPAVDG